MKSFSDELSVLLGEDKLDEVLACLDKAGFEEPEKSRRNLQLMLETGHFTGMEAELVLAASAAPDPDLALNNLERLFSTTADEIDIDKVLQVENLKTLATLCGGSRFLTNIVLRRPDLLEWLFLEGELSKNPSLEEMQSELGSMLEGVSTMDELQRQLRSFKAREYLRIGLRDLMGMADVRAVMAGISDLASASLQGAYGVSSSILQEEHGLPIYETADGEEKEANLMVLGMGKFGGRELNFSSDIDLIFLYTTDRGETRGRAAGDNRISLHQYFVKLGKMIFKALNDVTEDGFVFRVDMDLRPEGQSGDLACSLRSAEIYYESWGQTWERSAMLKARPVAGDISLGNEFLQTLRPFMYRKFLDYTAIEEIRAMKKKIDTRIARDDQLLTNLKLGTGGIREIEFFIQALQLINAGKIASLREKNSLIALNKLRDEGLISDGEEKELTEAYIFLRTVEHRLQIFEERQTHTLPNDSKQLEQLARRSGYREDPLENFIKDHQRHTKNVKEIYSSLFHEAAEKLEEEKNPEIIELLEGLLEEEELMERLAAYGFKDPAAAGNNLSLLWNGPPFAHFTEKSKSVLRRLAPLIFKEITASPEPDMALNAFESFIAAVGARATLYSLLAENHHVIRFLIGLFGTSSFLSKILLSYPETLDSLVSPAASAPVKESEEIRKDLFETVYGLDDYEARLDAMRRFRNVEMLRIGMNDIYGEIDLNEVSSQLSALADASLEVACDLALEQIKERFGIPMESDCKSEAKMVVVAMGKLGGKEMAYSSDLDIIFIYSGSGETSGSYGEKADLKVVSNQDFFAKVGQNIISILSIPTREGFVFKVDTRLRPSGSSGTLVASLGAFMDYHEKSGQTWERQALTRARIVAGAPELGNMVMETIEKTTYGTPATEEIAEEIDRMRKRMEFELAKEKEGIYNVKTGKGGLVDIEFIIQYLLLKYGSDKENIRSANTALALEKLADAGLIGEEDFSALSGAHVFLRKIENAIRIVHDQSLSRIDTKSNDFIRLSKRLGYDTTELINKYLALTGRIRQIYNTILGVK